MEVLIVENIYFDQILNQKNADAMQLQNSSYLEDLTGLLEKSASAIDSGTPYCFSSKYYLEHPAELPNSSFNKFINDFKNSFFYSSPEKVHIIIGFPGIGKTLFFNKGIQILLRDKKTCNDKYIKLGIDFKNVDTMEKIDEYTEYIHKQMRIKAIDAIRQLGKNDYTKFATKYIAYCKGIYDTPFACFYPVYYFCKCIFKKYSRPGIIILDNIDLASVETQEKVFKATSIVSGEFFDFMNSHHAKEKYRIYFAMRPETFRQNNEMCIGQVIEFPLPNIHEIALDLIKTSLTKTARNFDRNEPLKCEVTYYNILTNELCYAKKYIDIANYFNAVLSYFFKDLWNDTYYVNRLGSCRDFHCNIVNYNIRAFLNFLVDTLTNGGFKPLTKDFTNNQYSHHYNIFDYIEMIIKGRWEVYPGIKRINGEGGNKAPIVFNVFDTSLFKNTQAIKIKHFLLYIYILEILNECDEEDDITFGKIEKELSVFFDKEYILIAMQELVLVHLVYSYDEGEKSISGKKSYSEVEINEKTVLHISKMGTFYIEKFVCEFEYLYQMSLTSLMPSEYVDEMKTCWASEKEQTVLYFLKGIFEIIQINLNRLNSDELNSYIQTFCIDNKLSSRTYRRMLQSYISVIEKKIYRAETRESKNTEKLNRLLSEATNFKKTVIDYFNMKLGD